MLLLKYVGKRLLFLIPQLLGISLIAFTLLRLLPGNPAHIIAGGFATEETIQRIEQQLGLDQPLPIQYWYYLRNVLHGDLGTSWYTSNPVIVDFAQRIPATLELVTLSLLVAVLLGIPLGVFSAANPKGGASRLVFFYSLLSGSLPDFWVGLILIFIFYFNLGVLPAPLGRLDLSIIPPTRITGMYLVDSLLTGNGRAFISSAQHLVLPVLTLAFVNMGAILKMTRSTMEELLRSDFVYYLRASGSRDSYVMRQTLRNALPPVITITAVLYGYLLSGAVLVEAVFGWGGLGQYAVQSIANSDFAPIQGFVLVTAVFTLFLYLIVDLLYFMLDPRTRA